MSATASLAGVPPLPAAAERVPLRNWIAVGGGVLGAFMAVLDIQITNSSLADIQGALGASLDEGSWISTGYLIAEIIVIPLTGWLALVFGMRRLLLVCCVLFLGFSMLCGMARNLEQMILFRIGQGFTGGVLIPLAFTILLVKLPVSKRAIGSALFGFSATFAPAIGPTLGGWLTETYSWQWIFYINLLPGAVLVAMIWYGLDDTPAQLGRLRRGDWGGIVSMAIGLGCLEYVLEEGQRKDWFGNDVIRLCAWLAGIFLVAFVVIEFVRREPFNCFHVFAVYPWSRLLGRGLGEHPLSVLDNCRITSGAVLFRDGDSAEVLSRKLDWDGHALTLSKPAVRRIDVWADDYSAVPDVAAGNEVAIHWGRVCGG